MLIINFKNNIPQQNHYNFSVVGNNKSNKIKFVLDKYQDEVDLSEFNAYVKVMADGGDFVDIMPLSHSVVGSEIEIVWELKRKTTQFSIVECQLSFKKTANDDSVVWQSAIFGIELLKTIKAEQEISDKYPTILEEQEAELENHEERIEALEQDSSGVKEVDVSLENNELDVALKDKDGEVISHDSVGLPFVNKTTSASKVYGTDANGEQTTYDAGSFGQVDDVQVNGYSVVVNKVANIDLSSYATKTEVQNITALIPAQATSENQLADRNFVNSSIATNTAYFRGTYANVSELLAYSGELTNNDYANVINSARDFADTTEMNAFDKSLLTNFDFAWIPNNTKYDLYRFNVETQVWSLQETSISKDAIVLPTVYNRYTYNAQTETWSWNYSVNTSGFTADQWASINSGITAEKVSDMALKSADNTFSGNNTFTKTITFTTAGTGFDCVNYMVFKKNGSITATLDGVSFSPYGVNKTLGDSYNYWKEAYIKKITDTKGSYDSDNTINSINASDIVNNRLTTDQISILANGKETYIKGTLRNISNLLLFSITNLSGDFYNGFAYGLKSNNNLALFGFRIYQPNGEITFNEMLSLYGTGAIEIPNLSSIKGKYYPANPSNIGTFVNKMINGTWSWAEEKVMTQADYDALATKDANTTYYIEE